MCIASFSSSSWRVKGSDLTFHQILSMIEGIEGHGAKTKELTACRDAGWLAKIDRKK